MAVVGRAILYLLLLVRFARRITFPCRIRGCNDGIALTVGVQILEDRELCSATLGRISTRLSV